MRVRPVSGYRRQRVRVKALREGTDFGVLHRTSPRGACCWLAEDAAAASLAMDGLHQLGLVQPAAGVSGAPLEEQQQATGESKGGVALVRRRSFLPLCGSVFSVLLKLAGLRSCFLPCACCLLPAACCPLFSAFRLPPSALFTDGGISVCRLPLQVQQAAGKSVGEGGGSLSEGLSLIHI